MRRVGWRLVWLAAALLAATVALNLWGRARVGQARRALARDGRPLQVAQIVPPALPEAENGAPLLLAAASLLAAESVGANALTAELGRWSGKDSSAALPAGAWAARREVFQRPSLACVWPLVCAAAQRRGCRFERVWNQGPALLLPEVGPLRALSRYLAAKALAEAHSGEPEQAWETARIGRASCRERV